MLQAFVKMVGANVGVMEEHVTQAEGELGTIPSAFKKIFRTMSVPGFLNVRAPRNNRTPRHRRLTFCVCVCVCVPPAETSQPQKTSGASASPDSERVPDGRLLHVAAGPMTRGGTIEKRRTSGSRPQPPVVRGDPLSHCLPSLDRGAAASTKQ